jgi:hypothetical protein
MIEEFGKCRVCGGDPQVFVGRDSTEVRCKKCGITTGLRSHQTARIVWNTLPAEYAMKSDVTRYRRALHNIKEDCIQRKNFVVSEEEKWFLTQTILHIEAVLDFNSDTEKEGRG